MTNKTRKKSQKEVDSKRHADKEAARRLKEAGVAKQIQAVLETNNMALQPFIEYSQYGMAPRVRLVEVPDNSNADVKEGNSTEVGESENTDSTTGAE